MMRLVFVYYIGKAVGYSFIRDLNLIVRHSDIILLLEDDADNSLDLQRVLQRGELEEIKRSPFDMISRDEFSKYYCGRPLDINGTVFTPSQAGRFISPGRPKLPALKAGSTHPQSVKPSQQPLVIKEVVRETQEAVSQDKLDSVLKALEGLPASLTNMVKKAVADNVPVTVNQIQGSNGNAEPSVQRSTTVPVPVILDDNSGKEVKSNIGNAAKTAEGDSSALREKLRKKRGILNN